MIYVLLVSVVVALTDAKKSRKLRGEHATVDEDYSNLADDRELEVFDYFFNNGQERVIGFNKGFGQVGKGDNGKGTTSAPSEPGKGQSNPPTLPKTKSPTLYPTHSPTPVPSNAPTPSPTLSPTSPPSSAPKTPKPSPQLGKGRLTGTGYTFGQLLSGKGMLPSSTLYPTSSPSQQPTISPTLSPTQVPSSKPTISKRSPGFGKGRLIGKGYNFGTGLSGKGMIQSYGVLQTRPDW